MMTSPAPPVAVPVPVVMPPGMGWPRKRTFFGGFRVLLTLTTLGTGLSDGALALVLPAEGLARAAAIAAPVPRMMTRRVTAGIRRLDRCGGLTEGLTFFCATVRGGVRCLRYRRESGPLEGERGVCYKPDNTYAGIDEWTRMEAGGTGGLHGPITA